MLASPGGAENPTPSAKFARVHLALSLQAFFEYRIRIQLHVAVTGTGAAGTAVP
jgi:hypothetical protein